LSKDTIVIVTDEEIFSYVEPDLLTVLEELRRREPVFHTPAFGTAPKTLITPWLPTNGRERISDKPAGI
jgi:hypothetical protein